MLVSSWVFTPHLLCSNPADWPMLIPSSDPTDGHPLGFGPSGFKTEKSSQGPCNETDPSIWEFRNSKNNWYGWVVANGYSLLGFRLKYIFLNIANGSAKGWEWNQIVTKLLRGYMYKSSVEIRNRTNDLRIFPNKWCCQSLHFCTCLITYPSISVVPFVIPLPFKFI